MTSRKKTGDFKILIVGSKADSAALTTDLMGFHGFQCLTAVSGMEAIDIIQESEIHLVITDLDLPDINGVQLANYIRRLLPDTEVIITEEADQGYSNRALSAAGAV